MVVLEVVEEVIAPLLEHLVAVRLLSLNFH
jgi:hypothetical protein